MQLSNHTKFFGNFCNATDKLEEIKSYHSELEDLIEQEKLKLKDTQVDIDEDEILYHKKFHVDHTLIPNLRSSVIVSLATFLEIELQTICIELKRTLSLELSYNDFKGSIVEQFKIYVNKVALLDIDFAGPSFQSVKEVIELRNCIVHYDSQIEDFYGRRFSRSESIKSLSKKYSSIKLTDAENVMLEYDACRECIAVIEKFVVDVYNLLLQKVGPTE